MLCYELDFIFTLFCLQVTSMAFWRDLIFNLFCMQVTTLSFWIVLDLHPLMQVTIMKFWIEQDFNFAFFFMQVIHMLFWGCLT